VVARSVQPDLRYLWLTIQDRARLFPRAPVRIAAEAATWPAVAREVIAGWRRADVALCLGTHELEWMRRRFPWVRPKLEVYLDAPPPADQEALAAVRAARDGLEGRDRPGAGLRFLWMGRWVAHKGIRRLVRFLADRAASHPQDSFTLAGCGGEALRDCPPDLVRDGRIRAVPSFTRRELPDILRGHDAGLFTSEVEGWGLSLNEMLESGLPVFATRAGGVPDLEPCFPRSLHPFPPPAAAAGMDLSPDRDLDATGYYDRFTWPRIAERYEATVLRRLAAGPRQRAEPCASSR
jgi:glycosyltransferase involved in cell wall biosynthesis